MKVCRLPVILLGLVLLVSPAQAQKKSNHNDNGDAAGHGGAASKVNPAALPSASLQPFVDSHLDRILAPLGKPGFTQQGIVTGLKTKYLAAMADAAANRKPTFAAAADVCDALTNAMSARQQAVYAWHGSTLTHSSEVIQPRGGQKEGNQEKQSADSLFRRGVENDWIQQTDALRRKVASLVLRERTLEQQAISTPAPASPVPPVPPAQ